MPSRTVCLLAFLALGACGKKGDGGGGGGAANQPVTIEATLAPEEHQVVVSIKAHVMADVTLVEPKLQGKEWIVHRDGGGAFSLKIPMTAWPAGEETTLRLRAQRPGHAEFAETTVAYKRASGCRYDALDNGGTNAQRWFCEGIAGEATISRPDDGALKIAATFPAGSSFTVDGKTTTPKDGKLVTSIDAWPIIRALTPQQLSLKESKSGTETRFDFPVTVTSGGQTYEIAFSLSYAEFVGPALERFKRAAAGKPGTFPGEPAVAKDKPPTSVIQHMAVRGTATRADEIDLVATIDSQIRTKSCGSFASADGATKGTVKAEMADAVATVRDRRTGKKLGSKTFRAPDAVCPDQINGVGGAMVTGTAADDAEAQAWIDGFLKP